VAREPTQAVSVVIYLPDLGGGGAERLHIGLAVKFMEAGLTVTFLLNQQKGELLPQVPSGCKVETLRANRQLRALPKLASYLRRVQPDVLIANTEHMNVMSVFARGLARVPTRIIAIQHNNFSEQSKLPNWQFRFLAPLYRMVLPFADAIVAVSGGVADNLAKSTGLSRSGMTVIYNGVVTADFNERASAEPDHPWLADDKPLVLGIGRLVRQKDFATLIAAFANIKNSSSARLMILGDGPMRDELVNLTRSLGLEDRVCLPGFVENPLPYLRRATLFVLSSRFEGFGNVIAEALACGTPVVSTDCPHGPFEILDGGRYGDLVPVGNPEALGRAILSALARSPDREMLRRRGRVFNMATCAATYVELIRQPGWRKAKNAVSREVALDEAR
jgi:glycosyltransferase involved in cell wall biosynthesis